MLYLDYSRKPGDWIPNKFGGRENLEAIRFLKEFNEQVHLQFPGALTIAEESTAWAGVSKPTYLGGLGFSLKWNMGWMNDTLRYMRHEPIHRKYHHDELTFSLIYAFHENFVLPFSHDEVVHGKGSLLDQVPGDLWQKFANLRLLYTYLWTHPGKKLLFMGSEFGQWLEWNFDASLQWDLLQWESHQGLKKCVADLNRLYRGEKALHRFDFDGRGSSGSTATTTRRARSAISARRKTPTISSSSASTSPPCRGFATASECPSSPGTTKCSTATRCTTPEATWATAREFQRKTPRRTDGPLRSW